MPFAIQHAREKKRSSCQRRKRIQRPCPCTLCKGGKTYSLRIINRHLQVFGSNDTSTSSSDDEDTFAIRVPLNKNADPVAKESNVGAINSCSSSSDDELKQSSRPLDDFEASQMASEDENEEGDDSSPGSDTENDNHLEESECLKLSDSLEQDSNDCLDDDSSSTTDSDSSSLLLDDDSSCKDHTNGIYSSAKAKLPLHDGSSTTVLEALAGYFTWFTEYPGTSKTALSDILSLNKSLLPSPNNLPGTYDEAYAFIKPFLLPLKTFHACINDCILFRKTERYDYSKLQACPICGAKRYSSGQNPVRKFDYFPLAPRWKRMYGSATISEILQNHKGKDSHIMSDIHNSPMWLQAFSENGFSGGDPRAVCVQLSTDGVCPFSSNKLSYSMWPIMLTTLNLPRHVRNCFSNIMLVGVIPAQNGGGEPKSLDPYLEVAVDELLSLSGIEFYDAFKNETFEFKASLLNYVLDYPGCAKVFYAAGPNALQACMWCGLRGWYMDLLDKTVFVENRRFLPKEHKLRSEMVDHFPGGKEELRDTPEKNTNEDILWNSLAYSEAKNKTHAANIAKATGSKGVNCLMLLPNDDRPNQCFPDVMHNLKNVVTAFIDLLTGKGYNDKAKKMEKQLGRFQVSNMLGTIQPIASSSKDPKIGTEMPLPFLLSRSELKLADARIRNVLVPTGYEWTPKPFFLKRPYMKSHDWKQLVVDGILKFALRDVLGERQRTTLFHLFDVMSKACDDIQEKTELDKLQLEFEVVCAKIERDFPITIQTISLHILHHIVDGIKAYGPVHSWWMYAYERFNSWICQRVKNRRYPESNVMHTYQIFDWVQFMKMSGQVKPISKESVEKNSKEYGNAYSPSKQECDSLQEHHIDLQEINIVQLFSYKDTCKYQMSEKTTVWKGSSCKHNKNISSFVCIFPQHGKTVKIGQICHFLMVTTPVASHVFVTLAVFKKHAHDKKSGLHFVDLHHTERKTVKLDVISNPLVCGLDDKNENLVWLLNLERMLRMKSSFENASL